MEEKKIMMHKLYEDKKIVEFKKVGDEIRGMYRELGALDNEIMEIVKKSYREVFKETKKLDEKCRQMASTSEAKRKLKKEEDRLKK